MNRLVLIAILMTACKGNSDDCAPPAAPAPAPAPPTTAMSGTQSDLATEMDAADKTGTWQDLRHKWQGKQVTWTVTRLAPLCRSATACNVRPFPTVQGVRYGWMPKLDLSDAEFAKMQSGCNASEPCKVTFRGVLTDFQISGDSPTSLKFSDVTIMSAG